MLKMVGNLIKILQQENLLSNRKFVSVIQLNTHNFLA